MADFSDDASASDLPVLYPDIFGDDTGIDAVVDGDRAVEFGLHLFDHWREAAVESDL